MKSRVNVKIKESFRAQNLSSPEMAFIYKNLGRLRAEFLQGRVKSLCPAAWAVPHCWSTCVPYPISLIFYVFKKDGVLFFLVNVDLDPRQTLFSFVCSQSGFFLYCITQISFCLSVKYVCFCYSCPNWPCPVPASFFLGGRSLNIENSSFSAWRIL